MKSSRRQHRCLFGVLYHELVHRNRACFAHRCTVGFIDHRRVAWHRHSQVYVAVRALGVGYLRVLVELLAGNDVLRLFGIPFGLEQHDVKAAADEFVGCVVL